MKLLIRKRFPKFGVIIPGLGEFQDSPGRRVDAWKKGYKGGQPDLMIPIPNGDYNGLAIELKTRNGTGTTSQNQMEVLKNLATQSKYKTLVSNDYDEILCTLSEYREKVRIQRDLCCKRFKTAETLGAHLKVIHRVNIHGDTGNEI